MLEELVSSEESLFIVCLSVTGIVGILVGGCSWAIVNCLRILAEARLKQHMIDRDMAASDIERVLKASANVSPHWLEKRLSAPLRKCGA